MNLTEWNARLHGLVIFRALLDDDVIAKLVDLTDQMAAAPQSTGAVCDAAASFEAALFEHTTNFGEYLSAAVLEAETVCVRQAAVSEVPPVLQTALDNELDFLRQLCSLTLDELLDAAGATDKLPFLPRWETKVIANTRALLAGMPANNVLLYGDAGTGKSSTVKAIANEFAADGLRLVEVKKNQLYQIPDLMDKLAANPLKFILFIDDLSFTANDDNFAALKAILEGSVGGRARNIAVYATSNRRHLIKETLSDRTGDDIHEADTRQELMSLSARFGLTVTFQRPEKARFEVILTELAKQHGIEMPHDELLTKAEAFAIRAGGRSPRVAKQFIEQCAAGVQK